jgi:hypothetical protein
MEAEGSLLSSQEPATCPYPESVRETMNGKKSHNQNLHSLYLLLL